MKFCQLVYRVKCVDPARLVTGRFSLVATGSVSCISTSCLSNARKKTSQYSSVDTEKYSSLVKSVVSLRISSQTPASLEEEDGHIYGPVVKSKPATKRSPKTPFPLVNSRTISDRIDLMSEAERGPPIRIALQRGAGRSTTPSVTRILQQTMPPDQAFYLERWKKRMIAELGEEGFKEYTLNIFRQGKQFHTALETILMAGEVPAEDAEASEAVEGYLESIQHVLQDISDVRAIESAVQHQSLGYLGLHIRQPLQVAAYIGALNNDDNYKYQVERGLIVVAYKDGTPAHPHAMTSDLCQDYWTKWLLRLEEFVEKKSTASEL
ncbi:hypothetical protein ANANG_G00304070 [Anguilla anguilla]|uniref:Mitochondrial genome maintenance exonuclease 1 n=1 Tax=Anguilla anguilla TaxID=7936 RepID=A0A9D3LK33_ANGAN|nr:hypothetical protein ANANG_G00304070 [Anguilla anguilla]